MDAYSSEFRGEVLAACDAQEGTRVVALRFQVSESWVRLIKQQRRETGQIAPKTAAQQAMSHVGLELTKVVDAECRLLRQTLKPGVPVGTN
ncbi:MAG: hypothetical protein SH850_31000 [Planctomycetaceae bacterium]|nr:hypothetical protein [Planctomycetaceae bacterium]